MSRSTRIKWLLFASALLIVIGTFIVDNLPRSLAQHETIVLGESRFPPGGQAVLQVVVHDHRDAKPVPDAQVILALQAGEAAPQAVYTGTTDANGNAAVSFPLAADLPPDQKLIVETRSTLGTDRLEQPIKIERTYRLLLTTDKPIYQPGQVIHLRALALSASDRTPAANQAVEFVIADGKGNKVFRQTVTTSDFGVASADFQLATEVNTGNYNLAVQLGETSSEKTVEVKPYVLPKFEVTLTTDRAFYQPGQYLHGTLNANYFFGKPVSAAQVMLEGYTFDVERTVVASLKGQTDARGNFDFGLDLPAFIAGSDLDSGLGRFYLQATVIDQAQHSEVSNLSLPVSQDTIVIRLAPESGQLRQNVENILYVMTSTPDGAPIEADVSLTPRYYGNQVLKAHTDRYGLAEVRFTPQSGYQQIDVTARGVTGGSASRKFNFQGDYYGTNDMLLRPNKPIYSVGEPMQLDLFSTQTAGLSVTVYLDIVREGQTASTRAVPLVDGRAKVVVDLTPDLVGTLELHAYRLNPDGRFSRDTRLVIVNAAADLNVVVQTDRSVYRPGDQAKLDFSVTGTDGAGAQSAIGLAIVDESVFALAEQDPGFARLYFLLEQELLEPKYELHGFSLVRTLDKPAAADQPVRQAQTVAASASLAEALTQRGGLSLAVNTHDALDQRVRKTQQTIFAIVSKGMMTLSIVMAGVIAWNGGVWLHRRKRLGLSVLFTVIGGVIFYALINSRDYSLVIIVAIGLALSIPIGLIVLTVLARRRKDFNLSRAMRWLGLYLLLLIPLAFFYFRSGSFSIDIEWLAGIGLGLVGLMFCMLLAGEIVSGCGPQAASVLLIFLLILAAGCAAAAIPGPPSQEQTVPIANKPAAAAPAEPPRLRQFFPETLLWLPDAVTDANGRLSVEVPIADSITTWRMTTLASTRDGRLGTATGGLRVFQDFFIDLDLPTALTVGDEVSIPVGVFNYLPASQTVRLEVSPADWFELLDEPIKSMDIAANDVSVMYFRLRARAFGLQPFKVTAYGTQLSDAIQKNVTVLPNGKQVFFTHSDRLSPEAAIKQTISFPAQTITGTPVINVKIYPGIMSQVVEGLDSLLHMPYGCFEQTSSSTYPNVLVLDYLRSTQQASPEVQLKAEQYINLGYQRLTTFEVGGGGFSLFGHPPASQMLTAYGLQEFGDMSRVRPVDPLLIKRAADWLLAQQQADGAWGSVGGLSHGAVFRNLRNPQLPGTAYAVWSLIEAGYLTDAGTQRGLTYLRAHAAEAGDAYVLALIANAQISADQAATAAGAAVQLDDATRTALSRLAELAVRDKNRVWWSSTTTYTGAQGRTGDIETTALAALALLRAGEQPQLANDALTTLVQQKDNNGTWYSTQATILTLKALLQSVRSGIEHINATVSVKLDDSPARTLQVTAQNFDVTQVLSFNDLAAGDHTVEIAMSGAGNLMYQIAGSSYLPWHAAPVSGELVEPVTIGVKYDRTQLSLNESVRVNVSVKLNPKDSRAETALIDLGVPPGFSVQTEDLDQLVASYEDVPDDLPGAKVERYELTGRQVLIYLTNLSDAQPLNFSYRLRARFPLTAQTPASVAYDYYNPDISGEAQPQTITVMR